MTDYCPLPLDVVVNILVRLSVMSLLRLRSVCKSWRCLIDSSPFIKQHLLHEDANSNGCIIVKPNRYFQKEWTLLSGHQFEVRVTIDPITYFSLGRDPPNNQGEWTILSSCNGIVCLSELWTYAEILCVALWNPATRQLACLPEPAPLPASGHVRKNLGFGYAVKVDDYKVIRVVEFMSSNPDSLCSVLHHQAEIYDLSTNCWRNIDVNLPSGPCISSSNIYCNGRYFWDLSGLSPRRYSILSFDFSDEDFKIIILPDVLSTNGNLCLTTMRDCIACIDSKYFDLFRDGQFDIWVMTKYADKDSWTKLHTVRFIGPFTHVVLEGFSENGEILLLCDQNKSGPELACTDLKTQQIQNLNILYMEYAVYKESLVSIKKAMDPSFHRHQNDPHHVRTNVSTIG